MLSLVNFITNFFNKLLNYCTYLGCQSKHYKHVGCKDSTLCITPLLNYVLSQIKDIIIRYLWLNTLLWFNEVLNIATCLNCP